MNTDNRLMERVAKAQNEQAFREQARLTVASEVLGYLEPETCRTMALGIADVLVDSEPEFACNKGVQHSAWAIATLLRVANLQEAAEDDAGMKARREDTEAEREAGQ